jgi:hypothetical protein
VRYLFKFVVVLSAAVPAAVLCSRMGRPGADLGFWRLAIVAAPVLLALGVIAELLVVPRQDWAGLWIGTNINNCLTIIPLLSIAPLVGLILALRQGAPTQPVRVGMVAGLAAASIAAFLYASNCPDDSPLFVASWYPLAMATVVLTGGLCGARLLKW